MQTRTILTNGPDIAIGVSVLRVVVAIAERADVLALTATERSCIDRAEYAIDTYDMAMRELRAIGSNIDMGV